MGANISHFFTDHKDHFTDKFKVLESKSLVKESKEKENTKQFLIIKMTNQGAVLKSIIFVPTKHYFCFLEIDYALI